MKTINLEEKIGLISEIGTELFNYLTSIPQEIRPDTTKRPGIQILARILSKREIVEVPIYAPLPMTRFFVAEKSVRTESLGHKTSQDSEDVQRLKFAGCVSRYIGGDELHVSVSGLSAVEDTTVAIIVLSRVVGVSIDAVIIEIQEDGGKLPKEIFQEGHYLQQLLQRYRK